MKENIFNDLDVVGSALDALSLKLASNKLTRQDIYAELLEIYCMGWNNGMNNIGSMELQSKN